MKHFLLLCNRPAKGTNADTILEHIDSLIQMPGWKVWEISMIGNIPNTINLSRFDAIGIHYSLHLSDPDYHYLSESSINLLSRFLGLKCIWMHDEYRRVNAVVQILKRIGIDVIFSLASGSTLETLYPKKFLPDTRLETVLAGYVSNNLRTKMTIPINSRPIDISYRTRRPPFWLGYLGQEKINIGESFVNNSLSKSLNLDISVEEYDRVYGDEWLNLLINSKAVLCVESGSSVIDFSGNIELEVEKACEENKKITFREIKNRYLLDIDGKYLINPISPRVFEAAAMGTVMIGFIGHYSGIMKSWVHYIPLEKDFSNINTVIDSIKDIKLLEKIAANAKRDLVEVDDYSYEAFSAFCGRTLLEELHNRTYIQLTTNPYIPMTFMKDLLFSPKYIFHNYITYFFQIFLLRSALRFYMCHIWLRLPLWLRQLIKPILKILGR